jgi:hypothetical protein
MRAYRWALQYDRNVTSRVNPEVDVEKEITDAEVVEVIEAPEFDDTEPSTISLPDHSDWY